MRDVSFGQYYPVDSVVHRLDPRVKIVLVAIFITTVFFAVSYLSYALVAVFVLFAILVSRVPLLKVLRSVRMVFVLILFTVLMSVLFYTGDKQTVLFELWGWRLYTESLIAASKMALRLILLVMGPSLLTLTTTPVEMTDGLERLLKPLSLLRVPVHEFGLVMSMTLCLIPSILEEADKIIAAQKARCADFESGNILRRARALLPILIPLFVSSFRRAEELANAIDSRCYRGAKGRTRMKVLRLGLRDLLALLILGGLLFGVLTLTYNYFSIGFVGGLL